VNLKSAFGCHTTPFTREVRVGDQFSLPFFDQARDGILRALEKRSSAALIAPAGSGKSTILRCVLHALPEARYVTHYVKCTTINKRDMYREVARVCGVPISGSFPLLLHRLQEKFEADLSGSGRRPALFLDEAHDLRPDVLSVLRVLTNFQMDSRLVLSVVLAGQPDLAHTLDRSDQDAMARRIVHYATLRPLSRDEVAKYVEHRMTIAGAHQCPFDAGALDALYEIGRGNLRCTDNLALESLELCAAQKIKVVGAAQVAAARKSLYPAS
jgi:type II secretory pathway predicted ATPase ExeA